MEDTLVSVIIPCKNEGENIRKTLDSILGTKVSVPYEIIVVDDASTDDCVERIKGYQSFEKVKFVRTSDLGAAGARNYGVEFAEGEYLVFCDAHIFAELNWLDNLIMPFQDPEVGEVCPAIAAHNNLQAIGFGAFLLDTLDYDWITTKPEGIMEVAVAPGGCVAFRRVFFESIGGFNQNFRRWGHEDLEISLKTFLMGKKVVVNPRVTIRHIFRLQAPYEVTWSEVDFNLVYMILLYFKKGRARLILDKLKERAHLQEVLSEVLESDIWARRNEFLKIRKRSDDDFVKKFNLTNLE